MGALLRLCAALTRLGRAAAGAAAVVLVLADVPDGAVFMAVTAVGLHLGTLLLDDAGLDVHPSDDDTPDPGLGPFAYTLQGFLTLVVVAWVSFQFGGNSSVGDWMEKAFGVGLLYTAAGVVAVVVAVAGNPLGCRALVLRRAGPLLAAPAGGLLVFVGLTGVVAPLDRWTRPLEEDPNSSDLPVHALVALLVVLLVTVAMLGAVGGLSGVVLFGRSRFAAHRYHPVLPPIMDLCVAAAGVATLAVNGLAGSTDSSAVEGAVTTGLLVCFALADLSVQKRRLLRRRAPPGASPTPAPRPRATPP